VVQMFGKCHNKNKNNKKKKMEVLEECITKIL
jgi:hypothetical protein